MKYNIENMNTITSHITYTKYALIFTSIGSHLLEDILVPPTNAQLVFWPTFWTHQQVASGP